MKITTLSDWKTPEVLDDPYPLYRRLRESAPVYYDEERRRWLITKYADVIAILRDEVHFTAEQDPVTSSMLVSDPPEHTRLRSLVSKAFTPRAVHELAPRIQQVVDELLDAAEANGGMDVVADFAYPLPITIIAGMLGVDADRRDFFREATQKVTIAFGPIDDPVIAREAREGRDLLVEYFNDLIERRRSEPRDDLVSALIRAEDEGDSLSHRELIAMMLLLLVGGHETTVNLIANGLLALMRHPEQLAQFAGTPDIEASAIEELLRFESPIQYTGRLTRTPVEIRGVTIPAGENVRLILSAANRDPDAFPDPDTLDLTRTPNTQIGFGMGIHTCLGAPLARIEGRIALSTLVRRFPEVRLAEGAALRYRPATVFRGLESLPVRF